MARSNPPDWMGVLHDTTTVLVPRGHNALDGAVRICERDGIQFYQIAKPIGCMPAGSIVGEIPQR